MTEKRKEYLIEYRNKNRLKILQQSRDYYIDHKDAIDKRHAEYTRNNREAVRLKQKEYDMEHKKQKSDSNKKRHKLKSTEIAEYKRTYRKNNKEKVAVQFRRISLRKNYGLTLEQYNEMLEVQGGRCAICGVLQTEVKMTFRVDHDHTTGKVRGLLCHKCNVSLGLMNDNPEILQNAIKYLDKK
jgi:hypothetical protein